ncbi:PRC-barrel domain-containing protein [Methanimicrococcus blatticola]|uniref:Sporulation protein YlmC with PRC-barrel domain n=1 Tax=Methanimicrococcus blatticola TaxID=91560 RepID=A0A484F5P8_9EURY|nr:PRC-barrel domain-containing protein [Methanimicrococcus blatticola]MBZ3935852.1 PRC-barrel domain-containing protein [Methanimicrococcus blatticola]MCC2508027.1 PRC-barrel domain-containing protein [Methanimicrococcus blatticola]TDQ68889.1 sporulation protein YlmC with PRC-barrel domain [Methanimicrococcus blatticola]
MKYYAKRLLDNKKIMSTDAKELGMLEDIHINAKTGSIMDLVVSPADGLDVAKYQKEEDYILIPFSAVSAVKDYIIVDKDKAKSFMTR